MKKAFTMIELVFVIVVMGILAAVIIPNTRTNPLQEAALQVVSHIRYTQHLAMMDDKFNATDVNWYKKRWQLIFGNSADTDHKDAYSIFSDDAAVATASNPNLGELAIDPMSSDKFLSGGTNGSLNFNDSRANKKMNLGLSYGVTDVIFSGGCASNTIKRITFDHLGRPIKNPLHTYIQSYRLGRLITSRCEIILKNSDANITIAVEAETGYAHIL
ncbi:MAG: type II secretion system protein [Campylobacterota bacterium]|nr:type II secretion system protein [Campylobacterota bacterium]